MSLSSQPSHDAVIMSKAARTNAVRKCLRDGERYRNFRRHQIRLSFSRTWAHVLSWHTLGDGHELMPHPLLARIGGIAELVSNILSHLNDGTLFNAAQVSKKWYEEAVRLMWHDLVDEGRLLAAALPDDRVGFHAALVRQFVFTCSTNRNDWGWSYATSTTRKAPALPRLSKLTCEEYSLSRRSANELAQVFVPTLTTLEIGDDVAFEHFHNHEVQLPNVSWFAILATNCKRLTSIIIGRNSCIRWRDFDRFLKGAIHLQSVELGSNNEHLLVDRLAPVLKRTIVAIKGYFPSLTYYVFDRLPKMRALKYLEIKVYDLDITGQHLLSLKSLTHLEHFHIIRGSFTIASTWCTVTPEELAKVIECMPKLDDFAIHIPCKFVEEVALLHDEDWWCDQRLTYFPANACRQQYLDYLYSLADDKIDSALAMLEHLPFSSDCDA